MNNLYCYKMTWDTEFAPNPYHGFLTLATCKPVIRRCSQEGDWISGWPSKVMHDKDHKVVTFSSQQQLLYLAKIDKKLTFEEYWAQYPEKRPSVDGKPLTIKRKGCGGKKEEVIANTDCGDNIYEPIKSNVDWRNPNHFNQIKNSNHNEEDKKHDLSGHYVLICKEFYYFGVHNTLVVGKDIFEYIVPRCKKIPLNDINAINLLKYASDNSTKAQLLGF